MRNRVKVQTLKITYTVIIFVYIVIELEKKKMHIKTGDVDEHHFSNSQATFINILGVQLLYF